MKNHKIWNRCDYCGKFIGLDEFTDGTAVRRLLHDYEEMWATEHNECAIKSIRVALGARG